MIDPRAIAAYQYCPRQRFLAFEYHRLGLEPAKPRFSLALDEAVRLGLRALYDNPFTVDGAAHFAESKFSAMASGGLDLPPSEDAAEAIEEGVALSNAMVRAYHLAGFPFREMRGVGIVDFARWKPLDLGGGVLVDAHPDAIVFPLPDERPVAIFWRLCAGSHDIDSYVERHRIVAGVLGAEQNLGRPVEAMIQYIFKGVRKNGKQYSPLIRGYAAPDAPIGRTAVHWTLRGPKWRSFGVWRWPGIAEWLHELPVQVISDQFRTVKQSEDFALLDMLSPHGRKEWKDQVRGQESEIADKLEVVPPNLNIAFAQYRHSCKFCQFQQVCDQRIADPEHSGMYRLKH